MMKQARDFNSILDECLERVFRGEAVEQCLAAYPEHAAELEPLLRTALASKDALAIKPRPEFRERARYQFQSAVRDMESKKGRGFFFGWQPRWVTTAIAVLVILLAGSGTVAAAGNSLPGDILYSVKLATESVRLALTPSALGKAELYIELTDARVDEIIRLADRGDAKQVELASQRLSSQLLAMAGLDVVVRKEASAEMNTDTFAGLQTTQAVLGVSPHTTTATTTTAPATSTITPPETTATGEDSGKYTSRTTEPPESAGANEDEQAELRGLLSQHAMENEADLQAAMESCPESVKGALEDAIRIASEGYEQALMNLE